MKLRLLAVPVITAGLILATTPAAFAAAQVTTVPADERSDAGEHARLKVACARVPNLITRTENLQERLPADASTKGSIAWVRAKADRATANGQTELAGVLDSRADFMAAKLSILDEKLEALQKAQTICDKNEA